MTQQPSIPPEPLRSPVPRRSRFSEFVSAPRAGFPRRSVAIACALLTAAGTAALQVADPLARCACCLVCAVAAYVVGLETQ